jgi:ABC-2 type transport system ATP-binding protein
VTQDSETLPALEVTGAVKRFGTVTALDGVTFSVRRGELLGLLGPNGAGKTTMIKAIAGRVGLDAGTVRVFGREMARKDDRTAIGVVPQELAIYKLLTARENLEVFGTLYGVPAAKVRDRVAWALAWAGLEDRADESIKSFSGGMQRRLNIACGLLHDPKLVLLDEPTAGVDPQSRERIYEMLDALAREGVSVVLTTHHLEEAESRCERILIIDHGKIVASGTVAELIGQSRAGARLLTIRLAQPLSAAATLPEGWSTDEDSRLVRAAVVNVGRDVPERVRQLTTMGLSIDDMTMAGASLQDVFIALTGRELRE